MFLPIAYVVAIAAEAMSGALAAGRRGMITGTFVGVLCNDIPLRFRKDLYSSVSLVTGLIDVLAPDAGMRHDVALVTPR